MLWKPSLKRMDIKLVCSNVVEKLSNTQTVPKLNLSEWRNTPTLFQWNSSNVFVRNGVYRFLILTLETLQTKTDNFANSVAPDETARNEPSHLELHCLPFCSWCMTDTPFHNNECIQNHSRNSPLHKLKGLKVTIAISVKRNSRRYKYMFGRRSYKRKRAKFNSDCFISYRESDIKPALSLLVYA